MTGTIRKSTGGMSIKLDDEGNMIGLSATGKSAMGLLDRYGQGDRGIPDSPLAANPDTYEPRAEGGLLSAPVPKEMRGQYGNFFLTNRPENKPMLENPMNVHPDYTAQIKPSATETPAVPMSKENQRAGFIQFSVSKGKDPMQAAKYWDTINPEPSKYSAEALDFERKKAGLTPPAFEKEEAKAIGKTRGETYKNVIETATSALKANQTLDEFESNLKDITTGKITPAATSFNLWMKSLGADIDPKWSTAQALDSLSKRFALSFRNPAGGTGMPGNFSDQDRKYLEAIAPGLNKDTVANKTIIDAMRKINKRNIESSQLAENFLKTNGTMAGFSEYMSEYAEKNPLFAKTTQTPQVGQKFSTKSGKRFTIEAE